MPNKINNEYRSSDYERWQKEGFVIGTEIHRSKSSKCSCELCDNMSGVYPKSFKFQGWCDECKCFWVPIMLEGEDYIEYLLTGEIPQSLVIKTIPKKVLEYIKNNQEKLNRYYWVEELLNLNDK